MVCRDIASLSQKSPVDPARARTRALAYDVRVHARMSCTPYAQLSAFFRRALAVLYRDTRTMSQHGNPQV